MNIAIIGCGNMGRALAERLSEAHVLFLYDHHAEKSKQLENQGYGTACQEIAGALSSSEMLILAVKPQNLKQVAALLPDENRLIVSLLAGTPISALRQHFPTASIVRMMPNLALIHGEGVIGLCSDEKVKREQISGAFAALGKVHWMLEEKMDALTALTGSGPAFFFAMVEAMIDAGIAMGFPAKEAQALIYQMLRGSLTLLEKTHKHPGELRWQIASPEGTTIAGLRKLEEVALRSGVIATFLAAYERGAELSSQLSSCP